MPLTRNILDRFKGILKLVAYLLKIANMKGLTVGYKKLPKSFYLFKLNVVFSISRSTYVK